MTFIITTSSIAEASIAEVGLPVVTLGLAVPAPPTSLTATADGTNPEYVDLAWTASASAPVTGYKVFRALGGSGSYTQIGTTASTSYDDDTTAASTEYDYYVVAYNNAGDSDASNVETITTGAGWTPASLGANLISAWDAWDSSKVTLNGSDIASIADVNSVASLAQGTASKQPALISAAWNGNDIGSTTAADSQILLTGATAAYDVASLSGIDIGAFLVIDPTFVSGTPYIFSHYLGNLYIEIFITSATSITVALRSTTVYTEAVAITSGARFALWCGLQSSGTSTLRKIWKNGASVSSGSIANRGAGPHSNTAIGGRFNDTAHTSTDFAHISLTKYLSDADLALYFSWANTKFSVY